MTRALPLRTAFRRLAPALRRWSRLASERLPRLGRGRHAVPALLLLGFAAALRLLDLDARALWFDEAMEYWVATSSLAELGSSVRAGLQDPPLYSLLLHFWLLLGESEFHLRLLSVLFSLAGIAGIMILATRLSGNFAGLAAGALMAILPPQIRYAQEVGQYAVMGCLLAWSLVALMRVERRDRWPDHAVWTLLAIAATYTYYGAGISALVPAGVMLAIRLKRKDWQASRRSALSLLACVLSIAPMGAYFLPAQLSPARPTTAGFGPALEEIGAFGTGTLQLIGFQFTGWPWTQVPLWLTVVLVGLLLALSIRNRGQGGAWLLWLLSTWIVYYLVARLGLYPYGFRYGLILTPLLVPAITLGIANPFSTRNLQSKLGALMLVPLLLTAAASSPNDSFRRRLSAATEWAWPESEDLRSVTDRWLDSRRSTDVTYVYYGAAPAFGYYLERSGQHIRDRPPTWYLDCWQHESADYCHADNLIYGAWLRPLDGAAQVASVESALPAGVGRLWLIFSHVHTNEADTILTGLRSDYCRGSTFEADNGSLHLLEREAPRSRD